MKKDKFDLLTISKISQARTGILKVKNGEIKTPFFMPIATRGSVKAITSEELMKMGAQIILGNSYHLFLKPGLASIKKAGDLHKFINWSGPILTDSGGFQVFSLKVRRNSKQNRKDFCDYQSLVKATDKGVEFRSVYDGSKHLFTPVSVIKMQKIFGSDILMVLDQCLKNPSTYTEAKEAMQRTINWAAKSVKFFKSAKNTKGQLLFAIVQGSLYQDLRQSCAQELIKMDFDGYAIGGLAVGESPKEMYQVLDYTVPLLPEKKVRYLMGVGYPEQIIEAVRKGIDMFDCVIPTREARHGRLYFWNNKLLKGKFYKTINITKEKFVKDSTPINKNSQFTELKNYSRAYLRHLFSVNEPLALRLSTLNNLEFYLQLMSAVRQAIKLGKL
ncbi:tRNA guanosine(34) transglycosylase Tgt [Patescibacteria group bacterium]|nr:tRNA guanosine(34) transglycosylase Tgt [Patescibacteria group bacterium]